MIPGMGTGVGGVPELDAAAEDYIRSKGGVPAFKGYQGYPATICASVNEQVVHGIPGERVLEEGEVRPVGGKQARHVDVRLVTATNRKLADLVASGAFRIPVSSDMFEAEYTGAGMVWIDPQKEAAASQLLIQAGIKSRHQIIRESGGNPELVDEEIQADSFNKPEPEQAPPANEKEEDDDTDEETDDEQRESA